MIKIVVATEDGEVLDTFNVASTATADTMMVPHDTIDWINGGIVNNRAAFELVGNPWVDAAFCSRVRRHAEEHCRQYGD